MQTQEHDRSVWQNVKWQEFGNPYIPRCPTETPLYRIVYDYREEFEYQYEQLFEQQFGLLRPEVLSSFDSFLNCGIYWHGCARLCCEDCGHSELLAFSCKTRNFCPSCDAKRALIFAENVHQNILPQFPIRHLVWTVPKIIRGFFRFDPTLRGKLFLAAWDSWKDYCQMMLPDVAGARSASVMSLHLAGSMLNYHPHGHSLNLSGLVDKQGQFHLLPEINTEWLEKRFSENLVSLLRTSTTQCDQVISIMESWTHSGFNVHAGEVIEPANEDSRRFLARYLLKSPVALNKLELIEQALSTTVRYYKEADDEQEYQEFSPLEFLAQLSQFIPRPKEQLIRYYGLASPRTRGKFQNTSSPFASIYHRAKESIAESSLPEHCSLPEKKPVSRYWAYWVGKVFEVDPLECPKCAGRMKIKSFIHNPSEIKRICKHLGIQAWIPPKPIRPP